MNSIDTTTLPEETQVFPPVTPKNYKLIMFDLEGTLCDYLAESFYPHALAWILENNGKYEIACLSNQGGVGLRYWMETYHFGKPGQKENLPLPKHIRRRFLKLIDPLPDAMAKGIQIYVCYVYQAKNNGKWSPTPEGKGTDDGWDRNWRKPNPGMLLRAMRTANALPEETLMVGDTDEDRLAAQNAGCHFAWASDFFNLTSNSTNPT